MRAIRGVIVDTPGFGDVRVREDAIVVLSEAGVILAIAEGSAEATVLKEHGAQPADVQRLKEGQFLLPGLVDLHVHAPQGSYAGTATDRPLMEWLQHYTFPREKQHEELTLAEAEYRQLLGRLLSHGTTTALYFGSLHLSACETLVDVAEELGQRAFVGLTAMDRNSPSDYCLSAATNIANARSFISYVRAKKSSRLEPVITPRFVPSCTLELMHGLGSLAAETGAAVQSHISESLDEVAFAKALHPEVNGRDTLLLDAAGLLTSRCVMAHAVCLEDAELRVLAERGTAIAHCPLSNFFFADKLLRVRHCRGLGVKVGLGTDIAGGYSPSLFNAMRSAVVASKALRMQTIAAHQTAIGDSAAVPPDADAGVLGWREALWLATQGGAEALGLHERIGSFEVGKELDALVIDTGKTAVFDVAPRDTLLDKVEKAVNLGDDRSITRVFVQGRTVLPRL